MKNILKNASGFSMVQGMIIAGVVAGSSLVATRMLTDQKMAQKGAETRDQIEDFHNVIYSVLQNRLNCKQTMMANNLQLTLGTSTSSHPLNAISTLDTTIAQTGQTYMNNNIQIDSMLLKAPTSGTRVLDITYERLNTGEGTKSGYGAKKVTKSITLRVQKEPGTTTFSACYSVTGNKSSAELGNDISRSTCMELNNNNDGSVAGKKTVFVWDEANSICKPNAQCPDNQIYTGFDSLGDVKCRNIEDWMDFNDVLDSTPPTCPLGSQVKLQINNATKTVRIVCY